MDDIKKRADFVFSYWLFVWFLLYQYKFTTYNPKIGLIIGTAENMALLATMIYYRNSVLNITLFCFINTCIKLIPIYILWKTPYRWEDFYAFIKLFFVYLLWLLLNGVDIKKQLIDYFSQAKHNLSQGPFTYYAGQILNSIDPRTINKNTMA